jgi:predicted transcriptional regulator
MDEDLYLKVQRMAEGQNRNFSNFVVTLLKQTVEKQEHELA